VARFPNSVPAAGAVEYVAKDGTSTTLALLQGYVENQGDAWTYTVDYLKRFFDQYLTKSAELLPVAEAHGGYLALMHTLGQRTAELHRALGLQTGDPAFDPEPVQPGDLVTWTGTVREGATAALDLLESRRDSLSAAARADADAVLARRAQILERIEARAPKSVDAVKIRHHGDYHLGQVLLSQNDFVITDFEGEPARPLAERRQKHSPLRDVAGMLRSFNYAVYAALARHSSEQPEALATLESMGRDWETEVRRTFLRGYDEGTRGVRLFSAWADMEELLQLFSLEKVFYELRYELGNRPDWVRIPLRGILALTE
jgi:maltose alpha-D-glucosyltransferase/alpha-amylase